MTFPYITTITAGMLLIPQIALAFTVSGARGSTGAWVGDGGKATLLSKIGGAGAYLLGFALGGLLIWTGVTAGIANQAI